MTIANQVLDDFLSSFNGCVGRRRRDSGGYVTSYNFRIPFEITDAEMKLFGDDPEKFIELIHAKLANYAMFVKLRLLWAAGVDDEIT